MRIKFDLEISRSKSNLLDLALGALGGIAAWLATRPLPRRVPDVPLGMHGDLAADLEVLFGAKRAPAASAPNGEPQPPHASGAV